MTEEIIDACLKELGEQYEGSVATREGTVRLVKLPQVRFPRACQPPESEALVVFDPGLDRPNLLLKALPKLPNGRTPKSTSEVTAAGEGWYQFSYNLDWNEALHTAVQFVEGRLRRFALAE